LKEQFKHMKLLI